MAHRPRIKYSPAQKAVTQILRPRVSDVPKAVFYRRVVADTTHLANALHSARLDNHSESHGS